MIGEEWLQLGKGLLGVITVVSFALGVLGWLNRRFGDHW